MEQCIYSVQEAIMSLDSEIIVVDNNSKDDSCAMIKNHFPDVILVENKENLGFAKANNQGVEMAKGEYVCILNPDTVVASDTFLKMIKKVEQLPEFGLVGPRLIDGTGNFLPESKRNIPSPLTSFRRLFGIKFGKVKSYYADHIEETGIGDVDILVGAFFMSKRDAYLSIDGFDEDYFMYGEDIDLSYKMKKIGLQNYYLGDITAIHYKGESTDRNSVYIRRFYGAMRLFYKKHFKSNVVFDVLVSVAIRFLSVIHSLRSHSKGKRIIDQYFLVSENDSIADKISIKLNTPVVKVTLESIPNLGDRNIEIIFDNDYITYSQIINQMQLLKNDRFTFKIRPKNCNYIVGSDFSDGKGEVVIF